MVFSIPTYIDKTGIIDYPIEHDWNDSNPEDAYLGHDERLRHRINKICYRGVVALSSGFAEWIAWRLNKHLSDPMLFQMIESVWAGIIDWRYMEVNNGPDWKVWQGPVRGPLCAAFDLLHEIVKLVSKKQFASPEAICLSMLALHVVPNPKAFKDWRRFVIRRLVQMHPRPDDNLLGDPVPREALDPDFNYKPEMAKELFSNYLQNLNYKQNPFLSTPEKMIQKGFEGTPYIL